MKNFKRVVIDTAKEKMKWDSRRLREEIRGYCCSLAGVWFNNKKICKVCGKNKGIQLHHDDYSKPLMVIPLCTKHHWERQVSLRTEDKDPWRNTPAKSKYIYGFYDWKY